MQRRNSPGFPSTDLINRDTIEKTVDSGVDDGDLNFDGKRLAEEVRSMKVSFDSKNLRRTVSLTIDLA